MSSAHFVELCFECGHWFNDPSEWSYHCQFHLQMPETLFRCDPLIFRNAPIKAGYCPFCLGNENLEIKCRMQQFLDKSKWHCHIDDHLQTLVNDFNCKHLGCSTNITSLSELINHLWDWHHYRPLRGKKRKMSAEDASPSSDDKD